ncbi:MAG: beta-N-acetylglucosaminidase domain-containing protein [Actinomycetota bacterium]
MLTRPHVRVVVAAALLAGAIGGSGVSSADEPGEPYRYRGVIFGPYGRPWTHEDRMSVLAWMGKPWRDTGRARMNVYIHAAKDDVYQRLRWRAPYPATQMKDFLEEIALAGSLGVEWVPSVSPGFPLIPSATLPNGPPSRDICFSCAADLEVLVAKLRPFADAGVRTFMVSFDDVQKVSSHPVDLLAYGLGDAAYGRMNADLLNRLQARLRADHPADEEHAPVTVLTVPAEYSGTQQTAYLKAFGETLDADIPVMWTGTSVISKEILAAEAAAYSAAISTPASGSRKILVWDNFPVNDVNGNIFSSTGLPTGFKLNMGPYKGRGAELASVIDGIFSNPMNEAEASKIPLYTVAAYLNDPAAYTHEPASCPLDEDVAGCLSEAAWLEGIAEFGGAAAGAVLDFVGQMRSTAVDREESTAFRIAWQTLRDAYPGAFWPEPWAALEAELREEAAAPDALAAGLGDPRFLVETANHLATLERNVSAGLLGADVLAAMRPRLEAALSEGPGGAVTVSGTAAPPDLGDVLASLAAFLPEEILMRTSPYSVHGDRFQHSIDTVYIRENQMDAFTGFVHEAILAWLPASPIAVSGPVTVSVNGTAVELAADGTFAVTLPAGTIEVIAVDAASGQTGFRL